MAPLDHRQQHDPQHDRSRIFDGRGGEGGGGCRPEFFESSPSCGSLTSLDSASSTEPTTTTTATEDAFEKSPSPSPQPFSPSSSSSSTEGQLSSSLSLSPSRPLSEVVTRSTPSFSKSISSLSSSSSSSSSTRKEQEKSVRFSEYSMMYMVPGLDEYTDEEHCLAHYSDSDYDRFRDDADRTLEAMNKGQYPDNEYETFRGLEVRMDFLAEAKKRLVSSVVEAVLKQQKKQRSSSLSSSKDNKHNPDRLLLDEAWVKQVLIRRTNQSAINSHHIGLYDAQVAYHLFQL